MVNILSKMDFNLKINKINIINNIYKYGNQSFDYYIDELLKYNTFDKFEYFNDPYYSIIIEILNKIKNIKKLNNVKLADKYIKKELRLIIKYIQKAIKTESYYPNAKIVTDYNLKNLLFECKNYID